MVTALKFFLFFIPKSIVIQVLEFFPKSKMSKVVKINSKLMLLNAFSKSIRRTIPGKLFSFAYEKISTFKDGPALSFFSGLVKKLTGSVKSLIGPVTKIDRTDHHVDLDRSNFDRTDPVGILTGPATRLQHPAKLIALPGPTKIQKIATKINIKQMRFRFLTSSE